MIIVSACDFKNTFVTNLDMNHSVKEARFEPSMNRQRSIVKPSTKCRELSMTHQGTVKESPMKQGIVKESPMKHAQRVNEGKNEV